ncbi:unnamed protein product [Bursaphelenchus xylophilus]|uniref:(pine wood nematode) hypothetical protein n=1 Tax=Bursaphelenchus xylophilus TaxID=6326 RepID=A0A1I7SDB3_BURXY|nr:unnamed protein product [Bursaphelenchus xylophilus]CAG9130577.1 unnamed protein product [Bursaphelenchus xylophilus]
MDGECSEPFVSPKNVRSVKTVLISTAVILGVSFSWTLASQLTKSCFHDDFHAPFFIVWFNTNFMMLCYPCYLLFSIGKSWGKIKTETFDKENANQRSLHVITIAFILYTLWTSANVLFSFSLGRLSASASTSLISSNVFMVFILSRVFLNEEYTLRKTLSTALAVIGVVIISCDKEFAGDLLGMVSIIFAAFFASLYRVIFKKVVGNARLGRVSFVLSLLGFLNLILNVIPVILLYILNVEIINLHKIPWYYVIGSALLNMTYNFVVNFSIALITPLFVTIGALFGIPLNMIIDILFNGMQISYGFIIGSALILTSLIINLNLNSLEK